jgi:hypothetical protein
MNILVIVDDHYPPDCLGAMARGGRSVLFQEYQVVVIVLDIFEGRTRLGHVGHLQDFLDLSAS